MMSGEPAIVTAASAQVHHEAAEGRARCRRMAGFQGGADPRCRERWPHDTGPDRRHAGPEPALRSGVKSEGKRAALGPAQAEESPMKTVWVYVDTSKEIAHVDYLKVFANEAAAEKWLEEHDPEGVAFEYEVLE